MRLKSRLALFVFSSLLLALPVAAGWQAFAQPARTPPPEPEQVPPAEAEEKGVPYAVTVAKTGDGDLDTAITNNSALEQLRQRVPVDAFGLVSRALGEGDNLRDALRSEGYYAGTARITLAGEPVDAIGLADRLAARTGTEPVPVVITVERGPQYKLAPIRVQAQGAPASEAGPVGLDTGAPAKAQPVLDAEGRLTKALRDAGYPFAATARRVTVDHDTRQMEVTFIVTSGPRAQFATPEVSGQQRTRSDMLAKVVQPLAGQTYSQKALDETRAKLLQLGVFGTVRARAGERLDESGALPVSFVVSERPLHAIGFSAAYETEYGPTFSTYWEHRNLWGGAEKLRLEAEVNRLGTTGDVSDTGGKISAGLRSPWFLGREQTLSTDVALLRERPDAYDRDAFTLQALLERPITQKLTVSAGPQLEISRVTQDDVTRNYQLLGLIGQLRWQDVDSPLNPTRGLRAALLVNPIYSLGESEAFLRLRAQASTYLDLSGDKGSILALRGVVGSIIGSSFNGVPPDKRFYSGGGGSVRGYTYQAVGPETSDGDPAGGLSLVEGSIELRQRISGPWGMAAFVDGGSVTRNRTPAFGNLKLGAGLGVRYLTAIGPIRADVAVPLNREKDDAGFGVYIGIGQAF
jgi:translocation and assembly module TamA